uniref:Zinc transporter ZIP1 n=1 Tax=Schizaphis graminum TaxID=13262 RepID=A0A2S2P8J2_SCHGA
MDSNVAMSLAGRIVAAKACAALLLGMGSFAIALLPLKFTDRWRLSTEYASNRICRKPTATSLLLCFGGGVLLFTALLHLQPDVRHSVRALQAAGQLPDTEHLGDLIFCIGFFAVFGVHEATSKARVVFERRTGAVRPPQKSFHCLYVVVAALSFHETFLGLSAGLQSAATAGGVWGAYAAAAVNKLIVAYCLGQELAWSQVRKPAIVTCSAMFAAVTPVGVAIGMALAQCCSVDAAAETPGVAEVVAQGLAAGSLAFVMFSEVLIRQKRSGLTHVLATAVGFGVMILLQTFTHRQQ